MEKSVVAKKCNKCGLLKLLDEFFRDKANKSDGRYGMCKACKTEATHAWRNANRDAYNASMREYTKKHRRRIHFQRQYGISPEDREKIWESQGRCCKICRRKHVAKTKIFPIDHCHKSGVIRGIICHNCNRGLHYLDNEKFMAAAKEYLLKHI